MVSGKSSWYTRSDFHARDHYILSKIIFYSLILWRMANCAAASMATGTRNGEHDT